jgi:hypothetical protein
MPGTTNFPTALDSANEVDANTREDEAGKEHDVLHNDLDARTRALQVKVGIDGSADTDSLDYKATLAASGISALTAALASLQSGLQFKDEGSNRGSAGGVTTVNFVGDGVEATYSSGTLTVTIAGGGGGGSGVVETIVAGDGIDVDDTDPANPIVSATGGGGGGGDDTLTWLGL